MSWNYILLAIVLSLLATVVQWLRMKTSPKKERAAYLSIMVLCWALSVLLMIKPGIPGPTELVDALFQPLAKLLEK